MALVVETGAGVAGANSYLTVAELRAFAADRGLTLPVPDASVESLLIQAADYLELRTYVGDPVSSSQGLSWPRTSYDRYGAIVQLGVPLAIIRAQRLLAVEALNGSLTQAARPSKYVRTKIDVVYVEFAKAGDLAIGMRYLAVDTLLKPYLAGAGTGLIQTVRA